MTNLDIVSKYFSANENWGSLSDIEPDLLYELVAFRSYLGFRMLVSSGTTGKHSSPLHSSGRAIDVTFVDRVDLVDAFISATRFRFTEIGLNRDWHFHDEKRGGLHLGLDETPCRKKYWLRIQTENGPQDYGPNIENFCRLGLV